MRLRCCLSTLLLAHVPVFAAAEDTEWLVAPYGWLPTVSVNQTFDDDPGGGTGGGGEVLSKLDFAAMLRVEIARGQWGAMLDYITLSLSDETALSFRFPPDASIEIDADLDVEVLELGGFYRLQGNPGAIELLLGLRSIDVDLGILTAPQDLPSQALEINANVTDVFLGARYLRRLGERWNLSLRGDYGFGDSDGTVNLLAGIGLRINETFGLKFGYRHAEIVFEEDVNDSPEETEISLSGPYIGLLFLF